MKKRMKQAVSMIMCAGMSLSALSGIAAVSAQETESISYTFEDGQLSGWTAKGWCASAEVTSDAEGGNKYLRLKTVPNGGWINSTAIGSVPTATVDGLNYKLPKSGAVMISADFRFSETTKYQDKTLIDYFRQFMINSKQNEMPDTGGNVYQLWQVRPIQSGATQHRFDTYSAQSSGTVWWNQSKYQGAADALTLIDADTWYTTKTVLYTDENGVAKKASYYFYDADGALLASSLNESITNTSLQIDTIYDLRMMLTHNGEGCIPNSTWDMDNIEIKMVAAEASAVMNETSFSVVCPSVELQLSGKPDDLSALDQITVKKDGTAVTVSASFNAATNVLTVTPQEDLTRGSYELTLPGTLTIDGASLGTSTFTFSVLGTDKISYTFEDGQLSGWTAKGTCASVEVAADTEGGNKYLRFKTVPNGYWINSTKIESVPTATVDGLNYKLPKSGAVMISADFRFSETTKYQDKTLIDYFRQFMINSKQNEMPNTGGNVYQLWQVRPIQSGATQHRFDTYSAQSSGTVWWNSSKYQGAANALTLIDADTWYTTKTVLYTDENGVAKKASYYFYDADGALLASSLNESITNTSLQIDTIYDLRMMLTHNGDGCIPNSTWDMDNIEIDAISENYVSITSGNSATAGYTNLGKTSEDVFLAIAEYEKAANGALILTGVKQKTATVLPGRYWSDTTDAVSGEAGNVLKAFLWNGDNEPLSECDVRQIDE